MDINVAIIVKSVHNNNCDVRANQFNILLIEGNRSNQWQPSTSDKGVPKLGRRLPYCRVSADQQPEEAALQLARRLSGKGRLIHPSKLRRALRVTVDHHKHKPVATIEHNHSRPSVLFCIPVSHNDQLQSLQDKTGPLRFLPLSTVVTNSQNDSHLMEPESRHLILNLNDWLMTNSQRHSRFLWGLFSRNGAAGRLKYCVHNPAHLGEARFCCRVVPTASCKEDGLSPSDLAEEVRRANEALARMMAQEKCDVIIVNPLYGSGLPYKVRTGSVSMQYWEKNRPEVPVADSLTHSGSSLGGRSDSSLSETWADQFPMHSAAYLGKADIIRTLLQQGTDPGQEDKDSWTPLHYAAWYGQLEAVQALLNYGNCAINARNRNGSTALHFACWCGHDYVVELLLTHPHIIVDAKDKDGKTPLNLCECVPKPEWQAVANLLRAARSLRLPKMQVDLMDGSNVMLSLVQDQDTTASHLHQQMATELHLSESCAKLFAVWICSTSLELQLKAEHKPTGHIQRWKTKILPKWSDSADAGSEEPKLVFRRDARVNLAEERKVQLTDATLDLLFHEAHVNYTRGLYPCSEQDTVTLAALMLQILHGNYDANKDKLHFTSEQTLRKLLPAHLITKNKNLNSLLQKIISEHKTVTNKGAKNISGLQYQYLELCRNFRAYGSAFFSAHVFMTKPFRGAMKVAVGVNDCGVHLINDETKTLFQSYPLKVLEWSHAGHDKPYLQFKAKQTPAHIFTLQTRQASHMNMLLTKLVELGHSRSSSRTNLSETSSR